MILTTDEPITVYREDSAEKSTENGSVGVESWEFVRLTGKRRATSPTRMSHPFELKSGRVM